MVLTQDFPTLLRWWRRRRGWSQLDLAGRAEISRNATSATWNWAMRVAEPRGGDSPGDGPRRSLPPAQRAAACRGFYSVVAAKIWRRRIWRRCAMHWTISLTQQEPFPAVAVDREWNFAAGEQGRRSSGRIPGRPACAGCPCQPRRRARGAGRAAAVSGELARGGPLLHPQRRGGCGGVRGGCKQRLIGQVAAL